MDLVVEIGSRSGVAVLIRIIVVICHGEWNIYELHETEFYGNITTGSFFFCMLESHQRWCKQRIEEMTKWTCLLR